MNAKVFRVEENDQKLMNPSTYFDSTVSLLDFHLNHFDADENDIWNRLSPLQVPLHRRLACSSSSSSSSSSLVDLVDPSSCTTESTSADFDHRRDESYPFYSPH